MVVAFVFVNVKGQPGIEDRVHALVEQLLDMSVHQLRGITGGVGRDRELTFLIDLSGGKAGGNHLKAQRIKDRKPQRIEFIHSQSKRQTDLIFSFFRLIRRQEISLEFIEVGQTFIVGDFDPRAFFTLIARNQTFLAVEDVNGQAAVVGTALADSRLRLVNQRFDFAFAHHTGVSEAVRLRVQRRAERAHQTRDIGTGNVSADFFLKASEHRIVHKGTALHHDVLSQLIGMGRADDLIDRVLDDGKRESGGDILYRSAVLLRLLDRRIHKHGAAGTQVHGSHREQPLAGELLHRVIHTLGKGLDKRTAAGGTRFVKHNGVYRIIMYLEALDILTADIEDKIDVFVKELGGSVMRHCLDQTKINTESFFDQLFAVTGHRRTADLDIIGEILIDF